jgi:hypothetical protein
MSDKFSWGDGSGLTIVKATPKKPALVVNELITRCDKDGNYIYNGEPCAVCRLIEGEK